MAAAVPIGGGVTAVFPMPGQPSGSARQIAVVEDTRRRLVNYCVLCVLFLAIFGGSLLVVVGSALGAFSRGVPGAILGTAIGLAVVFSILLALLARATSQAVRSPDRLEVTPSHIRLVAATDHEKPHARIDRAAGGQVRLATVGRGRASISGLQQSATGVVLPLRWFTKQEVRQACESTGWQVTT